MLVSKILVFFFYILDIIDFYIRSGSSVFEVGWILIKVLLLIFYIFYINSEVYYVWNIIYSRYYLLLIYYIFKLKLRNR